MIRFTRTVRRVAWASLSIACCVATSRAQVAQPVFPPLGTVPYKATTDNKVDVANLNPEPFTGLVFASDGRGYAVNPYASTVVVYHGIMAQPELVIPTGWNPVSVGVWEPDDTMANRRVVVACNGSHGLFVHSAVDGRLLGHLQLDSEPADLAIDAENARAFVSCQGDNTVVQVDLNTLTITRRFTITCGIRPGPLYLDRGNPTVAGDERVYVAATITGNNTIPIGPAPNAAAGRIINLDANPIQDQLDDHDVFRIDPVAQTITPVIRRAGSVLFDLERNPINGALCILSTDSINGDPALDTEPKLKGKFAKNQLVRVTGVTSTSPLVTAGAGIDLDDSDPVTPGPQYSVATSVNQARTIAFGYGGILQGYSFVASAQSDVMIALDPNGVRVRDFQLPAGAQCYDIQVWPVAEEIVVALCLGTMTMEVFGWNLPQATPFASLPLGLDPTPDQIRRGRNVFLDGSRSADGRFSCGTCHPRGMTDMLDWPLRGDPTDEKDIMLTQSLLSITDTYPHHWRGERALVDFKKAWGGLLGAPANKVPTVAEMADFMVYVQSLQAPANPVQNVVRVIDDTVGTNPAPNGMFGHATKGQDSFSGVPNFNGQTCAGCHQHESGTDGTHIFEVAIPAARTTSLEVAHLRQLQHRSLDTKKIDALQNGFPFIVNENGYGTTHNGENPNLFTFIFDTPVFQTLSPQELVDTFRFTEQFDQGISPAVHWGARLVQLPSGGFNTAVANRIEEVLLGGAVRGWNEVVAIGRFDSGAGLVPVRWHFVPAATVAASTFVSDTPGVAAISWATMKSKVGLGQAEYAFLGMTLQGGRRFALDHDRDGILNGFEAGVGTNPWTPDFDNDGWPDGYETANGANPLVSQPTINDPNAPVLLSSTLDFTNSRMAKYHVRFNEDVKYTVTYSVAGGPVRTFTRDYFTASDTFVLTHEEPSTPAFPPAFPSPTILNFAASIVATDRNGKVNGPISLTTFQPDVAAVALLFTHIKSMQFQNVTRPAPGVLDAQVKITIDFNYGAPAFNLAEVAGAMVFSGLSVKDPVTGDFVKATTFTSTDPTTFQVGGTPTTGAAYIVDPGPPWVTSPLTNANGETTVNFRLSGLTTGQEVKLAAMGIIFPFPSTTPVVYDAANGAQMQPLLLENVMETSIIY